MSAQSTGRYAGNDLRRPEVPAYRLHVRGSGARLGTRCPPYLIARSSDRAAIGRAFPLTERVFQVSTAGYGLGIVFGFAAALVGALDLRASWLVTAYVLVALLAVHGILFDNWTKEVAREFASAAAVDAIRFDRLRRERRPLYLVSAMLVLIVAIVFVMVIKIGLF